MHKSLSEFISPIKENKSNIMDSIDPTLIENWRKEQNENREKLKHYDTEPWQKHHRMATELRESDISNNNELRYVAGLDISFVKDKDTACVGIFVFDLADNFKCVYKDLKIVTMNQPYVPGFLAYREAPFLLERLDRLKRLKPKYYPHCIFIDGNGLLHGNKFGLACHVGYYSDTPTIGVSKQLFQVFGLEKNQKHKDRIKNELKKAGDFFELRSKIEGDDTLLGYCYRSTDLATNPIYVSIGNKISWDTCLWILRIVIKNCRIPEPIRQADLGTRKFLANLNKNKNNETDDL
ncbi:endonuclease V [Brachionus plicatilis]|uniref:Endonuclease V n=1 Tax=Brachionus plicatilis TaxID=10195 RepID=A0A3M7R360_BRAPC|nr:endonuclease V [Brachionus plicatilis]